MAIPERETGGQKSDYDGPNRRRQSQRRKLPDKRESPRLDSCDRRAGFARRDVDEGLRDSDFE